jgi:integrase
LFLNYLYENNYLERDLSIFVPKTKSVKDKKIPTTLSSEEVLNLFAAIERNSSVGKRDYAIILFLAVYGCRVSDLCYLRLSNINWKKQKISFTQHKTGIPIEYELYDFIGEALADYLYYVRAKTTYVGDEVFITLSSNPGPINRSYVYNMLVMYLKRAGVENLDLRKHGPHLLRFTLATRLIEKNVDISYVKSQLGHKHTDITHNYIRLDKNHLSQCVLPTPKCVSRLYLSYMED